MVRLDHPGQRGLLEELEMFQIQVGFLTADFYNYNDSLKCYSSTADPMILITYDQDSPVLEDGFHTYYLAETVAYMECMPAATVQCHFGLSTIPVDSLTCQAIATFDEDDGDKQTTAGWAINGIAMSGNCICTATDI